MTAPAPSRSSRAGRGRPSGHSSPAAITATGHCRVPWPREASRLSTAVTLRGQHQGDSNHLAPMPRSEVIFTQAPSRNLMNC